MQRLTKLKAYLPQFTSPSKTAQLKHELNYFFDGIKSTVLYQLDSYYEAIQMDVSNINIIDIACGDGNYSRLISDTYDYANIVGVDLCKSQINLANKLTDKYKYPNIKYECLDASSFHTQHNIEYKNQFDIGLAIWFYSYAQNKDILYQYIKSSYHLLKDGGIIIGATASINDLNDIDIGTYKNDQRFGFDIRFIDGIKEGPFSLKVGYNTDSFECNGYDYIYNYQTYNNLFKQAGFSKLNFLCNNQYVNGDNASEKEQQLFSDFINHKGSFTRVFIAKK